MEIKMSFINSQPITEEEIVELYRFYLEFLTPEEAFEKLVLNCCYDRGLCRKLGVDYCTIGLGKKGKKDFNKIRNFVWKTLRREGYRLEDL